MIPEVMINNAMVEKKINIANVMMITSATAEMTTESPVIAHESRSMLISMIASATMPVATTVKNSAAAIAPLASLKRIMVACHPARKKNGVEAHRYQALWCTTLYPMK